MSDVIETNTSYTPSLPSGIVYEKTTVTFNKSEWNDAENSFCFSAMSSDKYVLWDFEFWTTSTIHNLICTHNPLHNLHYYKHPMKVINFFCQINCQLEIHIVHVFIFFLVRKQKVFAGPCWILIKVRLELHENECIKNFSNIWLYDFRSIIIIPTALKERLLAVVENVHCFRLHRKPFKLVLKFS